MAWITLIREVHHEAAAGESPALFVSSTGSPGESGVDNQPGLPLRSFRGRLHGGSVARNDRKEIFMEDRDMSTKTTTVDDEGGV